jgi:hypothetical protein
VSLLDDYEMKVTPNASAALKLISATWSLWIPFLAGFRFVYFGLISATGLDLICLEAP